MKRLALSLVLLGACDVGASAPPETAPAVAEIVHSPAPVPAEPAAAEPAPEPEAKPAPPLQVEVLDPDEGPLRAQIRGHVRRAEKAGQRVVLEMSAPWCPPCKRAKTTLSEPDVKAHLDGLLLLRTNSDLWQSDLDEIGFDASLIPTYYGLDEAGRPSGRTVSGARWRTRMQAREGLLAFLRGT